MPNEQNLTSSIYFYAIDIDLGHHIIPPEIINGRYQEAFDVILPTITNYKLIPPTPQLTGYFSKKNQKIITFWRKKNWLATEQVHQYLNIKERIDIYNQPDVQIIKAAISFYKPILTKFRIITITNQFWYQINEGWLLYTPKKIELITTGDTWNATDVKHEAIITSPTKQPINTYSSPYGRIINQIAPHTQVLITQICADPLGFNWCYAHNYGWLKDVYLK